MGIKIFIFLNTLLFVTVNAQFSNNCVGGNCLGGIGNPGIICPTGFHLSGGSCVQSSTTICGTGATGTGSCHVCPQGYFANQGQCQQYQCPQNYVFTNGQCQIASQNCYNMCQTGYVLLGGLCHSQTPQPCFQQQCLIMGNCPQQCPPPYIPPTVICHPPNTTPETTSSTNPPTPSPTTTTTTTAPPTRTTTPWCPDGLINDSGNCIRISCPNSTSWNGHSCQAVNHVTNNASVDIKQFINNYNNISNPTNVNLKNENTVIVYTADERVVKINGSGTPSVTPVPTQPPPTSTSAPTPGDGCCIVVTPRVCSRLTLKWVCYNRKYARCGSFCIHKKIYLRPSRPVQRYPFSVVPPITCVGQGCGISDAYGADCSGCHNGGECSLYCSEYSCGSQCNFYDQRTYCEEYSGQPGCFEHDGCYEDWCS